MAKSKETIDYSVNINTNSKDLDKLNTSLGNTDKAVDGVEKSIEQLENSTKNLKVQLKEANVELQKQIQLYGETSKQAIDAAKGVAKVKDQIGFAKELSESFNPDQKFKSLGAATQVAATGIQGVTSGMALFGDQSEDTEKTLLKVQSAMAFSDAISNLSNLGDQWALLKTTIMSSTIATTSNTAATTVATSVMGLFGVSVDATTLGFKLLKGAIIATGIGALVVGLVAVYQSFDKISKVVTNLVPGLEGVGDSIMSIVQAVTDFIGVTSEADRALDKIKANADQSLALNKKFLSEHESQLDEFTKQKIAAKDDYNEAIKEDGANQTALAQELNRNLAKIERARQDELQKQRDEQAKKAEEEAKKRAEIAKKEAEEAEKLRLEKQEKELEDRIAKKEQFEQDQEDLAEFKEQKEEEQEEENEKAEEQAAFEYNIVKTTVDQKIADDERALQAKKSNEAALVSGAEQLIKNVQVIAGKNKAIQRAAIIAEGGISVGKAVASTAEAITKDLAKGFPFSIPLVALDAAVGATSIASIVKGTGDALKAVGGGGGSISGASAASSTPSVGNVSSVPQIGFQNSPENQIAKSVTSANQNIKVNVLASDITDTQNDLSTNVVQNSF